MSATARGELAREWLTAPENAAHVVQFYDDDAFLCDAVAHYVASGLVAGEPAVLISEGEHREGIRDRLGARGFDVPRLCEEGRLHLLDARTTLETLVNDGRVDPSRFSEIVGPVLEQARRSTATGRIRTYGEMVDVLVRDGNAAAALELEKLWNDLGAGRTDAVLCSYRMGSFPDAQHARAFEDLCREHTGVIPTEHYVRIGEPDHRLREIAVLQQRARALETEIEQRKRAEEALRDALRVREEFLSVAGHELRTPLTALRLEMDWLVARSAGDERLSRVGRQVERLASLVEQLLDVSRITAGRLSIEREPADLAEVVRGVIERTGDAAQRAGCELRVDAERPVLGSFDRTRIEQLVTNLLSNAIKYGKERPVFVAVERDGARARIVVRDHGIGIAPEDHQRIFERFERAAPSRNYGGLGLGLWIAREVVTAHRGEFRVESEIGRGASFIVELPLE